MTKTELKELVFDAIKNDAFTLVELSRYLFKQLSKLGYTIDDSILCTYQYDMRWCLQQLRDEGLAFYVKDGGINYHHATVNK